MLAATNDHVPVLALLLDDPRVDANATEKKVRVMHETFSRKVICDAIATLNVSLLCILDHEYTMQECSVPSTLSPLLWNTILVSRVVCCSRTQLWFVMFSPAPKHIYISTRHLFGVCNG